MTVWVGDIEADGLLDDATRVWCGVFKNIETGDILRFAPVLWENPIESMLEFLDTVDTLIMHGGTFYDWPLLRKLYGYDFKGRKVDTLIMSRLQRPKRVLPLRCPRGVGPHSVEAWAYRVGSRKVIVAEEQWTEWDQLILERCTEDVEIQCLIYKALLKEAEGENWSNAHKLTFKLFENLQRSEQYGWTVDREHLGNAISTLDRWIGRIDRTVRPRLPFLVDVLEQKINGEYSYVKKPFKKDGSYAEVVKRYDGDTAWSSSHHVVGPFSRVLFRRVDLDKNQEVKEFLLDLGWEPQEWNTNSEGVRTSAKLNKDDPFEGIQGSLGKLIAKRVQCRQRKSVLEGWAASIRSDGRLPSVVTGLTVTGRARHSVIVNVPRASSFFGRWMRKCFVAKPGWVLVGTDSDADHYRSLAEMMGDDEFTKAVVEGRKEEGTDMHSLNQRKIGKGTRDQAKIFFYALLLGAQPYRLSKVLLCSVDEAKKLKEGFMKTMPGLQRTLNTLLDEWRSHARRVFNKKFGKMEYKDGWFTGLDGRRVWCENENAVLGYALQNWESTKMATAYNIFHKWMDKAGYVWGCDYGTLCWYHDEFTVECRPDIAKQVGSLAEKAIEWSGKFYGISVPYKGNAQIGNSWADIH